MRPVDGRLRARARARLPRLFGRPMRRLVQLLVLGLITEYLLLPQIAGARKSLHLLLHVENGWLLAALLCEAGSLVTFSLGTRVFLPATRRPALGRVLRIDLSTIAVSHVVPGGAAAGAALGYRLLGAAGVPGEVAGFAKVAQGVTSSILLLFLLWSALALAIPLHGAHPLYGVATVVGVLLLAVMLGAVFYVTRSEEGAVRLAVRLARRIPRVGPETAAAVTRGLAGQIRALTADRRRLAQSAGWALANWMLDAAALWCCLRAFGHTFGYDGLMVSYTLANVLAWVPITPSGLGVVEGVLVPTLVAFGSPRGKAILGVLAWRLLNFWLPIPVGAGAYLSLPDGPAADVGSPAAAGPP